MIKKDITSLLSSIDEDLIKIEEITKRKRNRMKITFENMAGIGKAWINFFFLILYFSGFYLVSRWFQNAETISILLLGWGFSPLLFYALIVNFYGNIQNTYIKLVQKKVAKISEIHTRIFKRIQEVQSPDEILEMLSLFHNEILEAIPLLKKQKLRIMKSYLKKEAQVMLILLQDFQEDLALEIKENQIILENASEEIHEMMKYKDGIAALEIQNTRLETQIEAFKNLEKVLVKA